MELKVKIKKLVENAVIPTYAKDGDAGLDLVATSLESDENGNIVYGTGLAFEIPKGYVGLVFPRSSNSKTNLFLTNSVGVIDSGYRGEVTLKFKSSIRAYNPFKFWWYRIIRKDYNKPLVVDNNTSGSYKVGDRVGQLIIMKYPTIEFIESDNLSETERGCGSYGSTGR